MTMQITDEMVEAALDAWYADDGAWKRANFPLVTEAENERFVLVARREMRAILEAALKVSAAPLMLEALQAIDADWTEMIPHGPGEMGEARLFCAKTLKIWRDVRAAIAAATGAQS